MPCSFRSALKSFLSAMAAALLWIGGPAELAGQSVELRVAPPMSSQTRSSQAPLRIAEVLKLEPLATLNEASLGARDQLEAVEQWNAAGRLPMRDGLIRLLPVPQRVDLPEAVLSSAAGLQSGGALVRHGPDQVVWGAALRIQGAYRIRAHLDDVHLPAGARLWVYGASGEVVGPFGSELLGPDGLWTPSVAGPVLRLEMELPREAKGTAFTLDRVAELLPVEGIGPADSIQPKVDAGCLVDVTCVGEGTFPVVRLVERAVGHLHFVVGQFTALCSGGLLNDRGATGTPFFLTANHCLSTQAAASSLEVFWDFFTNECFGAFPTHGSRPRSNGSTLLATGESADFSFLRLLGIPANRAFLGWNANLLAIAQGTVLHRVSTPAPDGVHFSQAYSSQQVVKPNPSPCAGAPGEPPVHDQTKFFYSAKGTGGTFGGSSGSPVLTPQGHVVGQLLGSCGPQDLVGEGCSPVPLVLDGAFAETYKFVSGFLENGNGGDDTSPCDAGEFTLCLVEDRFEVSVTGPRSLFEGQQARVSPVLSGDLGGAFHFFRNEENFHVIVKIARRPNGFFAVTGVAVENLEWTLRIRDTLTGQVKTYFKPAGEPGVPTDTGTFPIDP